MSVHVVEQCVVFNTYSKCVYLNNKNDQFIYSTFVVTNKVLQFSSEFIIYCQKRYNATVIRIITLGEWNFCFP